jgi:hypothetical protein
MYVEVFPQRKREHFTTMQNKWPNNSVNLLIFNVFESRWNELSIINKQHFMNIEFLLVHRELQLSLVFCTDIYVLRCHMISFYCSCDFIVDFGLITCS